MEDGQMFCDDCGYRVNSNGKSKAPSYVIHIRDKSAGLAALFSLVFVGVGQIYVGKIARGLLLMLACFVLSTLSVVVVGLSVIDLDSISQLAGVAMVSLILSACSVILWIWNIFDAYKLANKYNDQLMENGTRPW